MEISRIQPSVQPAELPFEKVAASGQLSEADKIAEASRQFEAMLLRKILSEAQKPMFNSPLMPTGTSSAIYQDMVTNELADQISRGGSFDVAVLASLVAVLLSCTTIVRISPTAAARLSAIIERDASSLQSD